MYSMTATIVNPSGLHAQPAAFFILRAQSFSSDVWIRRATDEGEFVSLKSVMDVLSLNLCQGEQVELSAEGPDERAAIDCLVRLVEEGFRET